MKKSTTFFTVLFLIAGNSIMSQSLDDILKEHFSAIGQDNILKVNTQKTYRKNDPGRYRNSIYSDGQTS